MQPFTLLTLPFVLLLAQAGGALADAPTLSVQGNKLVTGTGEAHRLFGVNRSGTEYACIQGNGFADGPMDSASIDAMLSWKVNTVRVPLNEECWLGSPTVQAQYGGANYQNFIKTYTDLLLSKGITPILELHWTTGDSKADGQKPMPDSQNSPAFWQGVANAYKDTRIIFDLFNEPYVSDWNCWANGGSACQGSSFDIVGMSSLVQTVRSTGNTNVIMLGGLAYSNDLSQWLQYKPADAGVAASTHIYNFNACNNVDCWNSQLAPVAAAVPLIIGELGENDCQHQFIDGLMDWADSQQVSYLGWAWNTADCSSGPSLISNYDGTPTGFGQGLKDHFAQVA